MVDLLIDAEGMIWLAQQLGLARKLGSRLRAGDLAAFVVRNMGYVGLADRRSGVQVSLRPQAVHPIAIAQTIMWLGGQRRARCLITSLDEDEAWSHHVCGSLDQAVRKIVELTKPYAVPKDRLMAQLLGLGQLARDHRFGALWQAWRDGAADTRLDELLPLLHDRLSSRYVVVKPQVNGDLTILSLGDGIPLLNGKLARQRPGSRLQDGLDVRYAQWAAKGYLEALQIGAPQFEAIDAEFKVPRRPEQRVTYRRLILPITTADGSRALLGASLLDAGIDLRLETRKKA